MDLFVDLKVPAVGGSQWTTAERQREKKSLCGNDLQTLLDFCGSPQNDAVERVKGIEPSYQAWEAGVLPLNYTRMLRSLALRSLASAELVPSRPAEQEIQPGVAAGGMHDAEVDWPETGVGAHKQAGTQAPAFAALL